MDASELGIFMFFIFIFPGFFSVAIYRWAAGFDRPMNGLAWTCCSVLFGFIDLLVWKETIHNDVSKISSTLSNPFQAATVLSATGVVVALALGLAIGHFRRRFR